MCLTAVPSSFLVCFSLGVYVLTISMMCGTKMAIEGLPIKKQEPIADQDILAGADFLSVFMDASLRRAYSETTSSTLPTTILLVEDEESPTTTTNSMSRRLRSTSPFAQTTEGFSETSASRDTDKSDSDGIILAVRVSSSVHKGHYHPLTVDSTTFSGAATTEADDQNPVASEEHPSIVARASKSELSVEENEPITKDSDLVPDYTSYPATPRELPTQSGSSYDPTVGFVDKDSKQPYHQTVIYHNDPSEPSRARSVSYSSIVQAVSGTPEETEKPIPHERHERNYNGAKTAYSNTYHSDTNAKPNDTRPAWSPAKTAANQPTSRPDSPKVYGMPEQNYEVDEAVSVVTNGRVHGIQSVKKAEDNQKVGYVVEGRNYRKYRVEERTADGFIVGEYGVVSHDDGSLRGVRYTADGTINPRLISEALLKFLSL